MAFMLRLDSMIISGQDANEISDPRKTLPFQTVVASTTSRPRENIHMNESFTVKTLRLCNYFLG